MELVRSRAASLGPFSVSIRDWQRAAAPARCFPIAVCGVKGLKDYSEVYVLLDMRTKKKRRSWHLVMMKGFADKVINLCNRGSVWWMFDIRRLLV